MLNVNIYRKFLYYPVRYSYLLFFNIFYLLILIKISLNIPFKLFPINLLRGFYRSWDFVDWKHFSSRNRFDFKNAVFDFGIFTEIQIFGFHLVNKSTGRLTFGYTCLKFRTGKLRRVVVFINYDDLNYFFIYGTLKSDLSFWFFRNFFISHMKEVTKSESEVSKVNPRFLFKFLI